MFRWRNTLLRPGGDECTLGLLSFFSFAGLHLLPPELCLQRTRLCTKACGLLWTSSCPPESFHRFLYYDSEARCAGAKGQRLRACDLGAWRCQPVVSAAGDDVMRGSLGYKNKFKASLGHLAKICLIT